MNRILAVIIVSAAAIGMWSCGSGTKDFRPASVGSPYEVLLICSQDKWEGPLGDTLKTIMTQPVEYLNASEPMFDILRILPNNFGDLYRKTRNILNVATGSEYTVPSLQAHYNVYASPQIFVTLSGPDTESVINYIDENRDYLVAIFNNAERDWSVDLNRRYGDKTIAGQIYDKFGVNLDLPKGYKVRNTMDDFMWISFEYPTASQGVVIYTYPYSGRENFTEEWLLFHRNQFVAKIPGENPGSHMTTYQGFMPDVRYLRIGERDWAEMHGFWEVEGDWMGGPFVSYSTVDREKGNIITFDFYVYSPDKPKRNFLRQLENLVYSINFPEDGSQDVTAAAGPPAVAQQTKKKKRVASSVGAPYEVLAICGESSWEGRLGDTLRTIMGTPVEYLNSHEPLFDVMYTQPGRFTKLLRKTRNILKVEVGHQYAAPSLSAEFDVHASPQLIVNLTGPDEETVAEYISEHRGHLLSVFNNAERDRDLAVNSRHKDKSISGVVLEKFGMDLDLPKGYQIRNSLEDFLWISYEYPTASQGVVIYSYPYTGPGDLSKEWLLMRRNESVAQIPSENPGSYMTTYDGFQPDVRYFSHGGREWAEMRGFWDVEGDYMGGPFASYSTIDAEGGNVVTFDFYVY